MLITATWQVTWGGVVLLDFGDCMDAEPRLPREQAGESIPLVRSAYARQRVRGNVTHTLAFSRVKFFARSADARAFLIDHVAALPATVNDATIVLSSGGARYQLAGARLLPIEPTTASERFICNYTLIGGALTPLPATIGDGADTLVDDDGSAVVA